MHNWVCVNTDFDGEETVHFGPRKETGSSLYQVDTLATISSQEKNVNEHPTVISAVLGDFSCIAVCKDLSLFKDLQYAVTLSFDDVIDTIEWSPTGSLLAVGTKDGKLYLVETERNQICFVLAIISKDHMKGNSAFKRILFQERIKGEKSCDVYILSTTGLISVMKNLDLTVFTKGVDNPGQMLKNGMTVDKILAYEYHTISTNVILATKSHLFTFGSGDYEICKYKCEEDDIELVDEVYGNDSGIVLAKVSSNGRYIFTVNQDRLLSLWSSNLTILKTWKNMLVADFQLLETMELKNNSSKGMKLIVLSQNNEGSTLYVQELPKLNTVYTLELNTNTYIANCPTFQESLYVVEGCCEDLLPDIISTIRFRSLTEAEPKTRLSRLLYKKQFDQAEAFAKEFKLDLELVYGVKVRHIVEQIDPWNKHKQTDESLKKLIEDLWQCLDLIKNDLELVDCCLKVALPTYEETCKLLQYQKSRLLKLAATKPPPDIVNRQEVLLAEVLETQHRLLTYRMINGVDQYKPEDWDGFMKTNLLDKSLEALTGRQQNVTFTIWQRHKIEWKKYMSLDVITKLLKNIPDDIDAGDILGWFRDDLIPFVSSNVPKAMHSIVSWILLKITNMELLEKKSWPLNALQFGKSLYKKINEVLQVNLTDSVSPADNAAKTEINSKKVVQPLHDMVFDLQQLYNLEVKNSCRLSLAQFQQETTESVTFRMLDQIQAVELIIPALQRQIIPYLKEHDLNEDAIFACYVKDLLERTGHIRTIMGTSLWESKAEAIIGFIIDKREKCLAILDIMKIAPLPWSDEVEKLIQKGLKLDHPMVAELKEQCRLVEVKKIMIKYGLTNMEVPSKDKAERLINYILRKDLPSAVDDALQVFDALELTCNIEIYKVRSIFLILNNRISDYVELLMSIKPKVAISTGTHVFNYAVLELEDRIPVLFKESIKNKKLYAEAAVATANYLQSIVQDSHEKEEWAELQDQLHRMLFLQAEYNIYMGLDEYQSLTYREKLFKDYEEQFFSSSVSFNTEQLTLNYNQIYRLADLLLIPRIQFQSHLTIHAARKTDITTAVKISSKLYKCETSEDKVKSIFAVCQSFIDILSDCDTDIDDARCLPQTTYQLASHALTVCSSESISDYLELCNSCQLLQKVCNECEGGGLQGLQPRNQRKVSVNQFKDDGLKNWSVDIMFKEDSLVMNSSIALPLVANFLKVNPFLKIGFNKEILKKIDIFYSASIMLIQHLKENGHLELTLQTVLYMISVTKQLHVMGYVEKEEFEDYKKKVEELEQKSVKLIRESLAGILAKIFNCNKVDHKLALTYILSMAQKQCMDAMKKMLSVTGHNYRKLTAVATVGIAIGEIHNDPSAIQICKTIEANSRWGYRLGKFKIQFKEAFSGGSKEKFKILTQMAHSEAADVNIITEFCAAFNLEKDDGLMMYLENVLTKQRSDLLNEDCNKLRTRLAIADDIIEAIKEKGPLRKKLKQMLAKTSIYDYESIEFILKALSKFDADPHINQGLNLLPYLKVYKRRGVPSEDELRYGEDKEAEELSSVLGMLPAVGKTRIPYHPLVDGDAWKIITPELDSETVSMWLPIAHVLKLKVDEIYLVAVQNMVKKHVACQKSEAKKDSTNDRSKCDWNFSERSMRFIDTIQSLLFKVQNISLVLACSTWLVRELPMGAEKILGLNCCVSFAEKWNSACTEDGPEKKKAQAAYVKFSTYLKRLSTERILFSHNMLEAHIVQLVNQPKELINKLYELPCVTADQLDLSIKRPDVNAMVKEIVQIHGLSLNTISTSLIEKWLPSSASKQDADQTCTLSFNNFNLNDMAVEMDDDDDANLKRVLYLLQKDSIEENAIYLFNFANSENKNTHLCIARALLCLLKIVDETTMIDSIQKSVSEIRNMLRIRCYLVDLDELHVQHSQRTFEECNKEGLVRGIWKNHSHQRTGILLTCALCLDYKIYDAKLWNGILKQLLSLSSLKHLEYVLVKLSASPNVWLVTSYAKAWQHLLMSPLSKVCPPLDDNKLEECIHYFNLLHKCPVIDCLNLTQLAQQYQNLGLDICAAGCLLLSTNAHTEDVKETLGGNKKEHLKSLENLINLGITNIAVIQVREAIFSMIVDDEEYGVVLDTPIERLFIMYVIKKDRINGLLMFAIKNKRVKEAEALLQLYVQNNHSVDNDIFNYRHTVGSNTDLEAYLKLHGLCG